MMRSAPASAASWPARLRVRSSVARSAFICRCTTWTVFIAGTRSSSRRRRRIPRASRGGRAADAASRPREVAHRSDLCRRRDTQHVDAAGVSTVAGALVSRATWGPPVVEWTARRPSGRRARARTRPPTAVDMPPPCRGGKSRVRWRTRIRGRRTVGGTGRQRRPCATTYHSSTNSGAKFGNRNVADRRPSCESCAAPPRACARAGRGRRGGARVVDAELCRVEIARRRSPRRRRRARTDRREMPAREYLVEQARRVWRGRTAAATIAVHAR